MKSAKRVKYYKMAKRLLLYLYISIYTYKPPKINNSIQFK